jgi:hypothetical protein
MAFIALVPLTTLGTLIVGLFVHGVHVAIMYAYAAFPLNVSLYFVGHVGSTFLVVLCVAYWRERLLRQAFTESMKRERRRRRSRLISSLSPGWRP